MPAALKSTILFLLLTLNLSILTTFVKAADPMPTPEPITKANYTAEIHSTYSMDNIANSGLCLLAGMSPVGKCPGRYKDDHGDIKLVLYNQVPGGGAFGALTNITVAMYTNPPTSTAQYLASIGEDLGIYKPVYAQGVAGSGAGIIEPVKILWQAVRNLTYLFFIVIFIAVGFMIMFRQKLNPQTIITAQAALPGLVVGLILVTFSYFISALLVDLSFVGVKLVAQIFSQVIITDPATHTDKLLNVFNIDELAQSSNLFDLFKASAIRGENFTEMTQGSMETINSFFGGNFQGAAIGVVITAVIGAVVGLFTFGLGWIPLLGGAAVGGATTVIIGVIVPLILIIALFIQFFKLLFKLITAYISILVSTILAPFIILFSSIPGRGGVLSVWWKTILGNALIFPAVFGAFLFAGMILATPIESWRASPPLFGGLSTILLKLLIAYGILLGTPAIPDMVKKALGVTDIQGIPQAAMAGAMSGFGVGRKATTKGWESATGDVKQLRSTYQGELAKFRLDDTGATAIPVIPERVPRWQQRLIKKP